MHLQNLIKFSHCLFKLLRKTQTRELALSHYFSIINVHLVDINMFTKFYEFRHCLLKILKKKPKRRERTDGGTDGRTDVKKVYPPPHAQFAGGGV